MEVLILGVYLEIFFFRITWSKIRVRIIHRRALYTGKYGNSLELNGRELLHSNLMVKQLLQLISQVILLAHQNI